MLLLLRRPQLLISQQSRYYIFGYKSNIRLCDQAFFSCNTVKPNLIIQIVITVELISLSY